MKISPTLAKFFLLPAAALLCLLVSQACSKFHRGPGKLNDPNALVELKSDKHIALTNITETEYIEALNLASAYSTDYCVLNGKEFCCDCLTKETVKDVLARLKTKKVTKPEPPDCAECPGLPTVDAVHVSQWVDFKDIQDFEAFLEKLKGNRKN